MEEFKIEMRRILENIAYVGIAILVIYTLYEACSAKKNLLIEKQDRMEQTISDMKYDIDYLKRKVKDL